jgi:hypothetical protein
MLAALDPASTAPYTFIVPNGTLNSREEMIMSPGTRERQLAGKGTLVAGGSRGIMRAMRAESPNNHGDRYESDETGEE